MALETTGNGVVVGPTPEHTRSARSVRVTFKGGHAGRLFKVDGSERWYLSYWHGGKEYRETTGTADFDAAKATLRKKLDELAAVRRGAEPFVDPKSKRLTVDQLLDALDADMELRRVKGLYEARAHMKAVRDSLGPWRALDVTPETVDRQIKAWLADDVAPATINRRVQALGQAFRFAKSRGHVVSVPTFRRLPENNVRQGFFSRPDFEAVVAALPDYLRDVARFAYHTGWRKGEVLTLTAASVDMRLGELRIGDSKNGDGRVIPLREEDGTLNAIGEIVERRMAARVVGDRVVPLLFHRRGRPVGDFRKAWRAACVVAGCARPKLHADGTPVLDRKGRPVMVPTKLVHDLRRTFAHDAAESGSDYKTIMEWTGHRTTSTFMRYRITSLAGMRRAAARVATFREAQVAAPAVVVQIAPALEARGR